MPSIIPDRSIIKISGADTAKFLQNLVTNDIYATATTTHPVIPNQVRDDDCKLSPTADSTYAMILSPQGRFLFDMFIIPFENSYLLDIFEGTKDLLLKRLRMYKINMLVEIEKVDEMSVGYVQSNEEGNNVILEDAQRSSGILGYKIHAISYKDPRYKDLGWRFLASRLRENDSGKSENDNESSYLQDKYKYAIPDGGIDLLYDKAMPQEYGSEQLNAISYTKGCYVGQEVISRTKSQGVVRKKIYKITADFDLSNIEHGTEITAGGNKIGIFCSGYKHEAIGLIREENFLAAEDEICMLGDRVVKLEIAAWY